MFTAGKWILYCTTFCSMIYTGLTWDSRCVKLITDSTEHLQNLHVIMFKIYHLDQDLESATH